MDQLITLLEKSYTSNDNQNLKELLDIFLSFCNDPDFYQSLLIIFQNETIEPRVKFAGLIYFKNIIQHRWTNLSESIQQIIIKIFLETIIHLQEQSFNSHIMQISDLLIDKNLFKIEWTDFIFQFIEEDSISSLILAKSLVFQYKKKDISEILASILSFIFTQLQDDKFEPLFLKISLKIIRHSFQIVEFDDQQIIFLIQFMIDHFTKENIIQYIKLFSKISKIKPLLIYEIESALISNLLEYINVPKISIHFFKMFSNFSENEKLWEMFDGNFIELFLPFFSFNETEIENPVQFINDHFFDSFSSNSDPNSAAFKCLEEISRNNESVIMNILELLKSEFENPSNKIYSISHLSSAVLKNLFLTKYREVAIELFNSVFPFLQSDSVLIKCGVLIILQFECHLESPIERHIHKCIEMIFDSNKLIQYFSLNCLLKNLSRYKDSTSIFSDFPLDSIVSKILEITHEFEFPQLTDLLHYLFKNQFYLAQIIPNLIDIVNSTFSLAQFYSEISSIDEIPIQLSSVFNSIITIIVNLNDSSPSVKFEICKLSFLRSIQMININLKNNNFLFSSILEVVFISIFYSPQFFDELWNSFDVLMPFLDENSPLSNELVFSIFAIIIIHDQENLENHLEIITNSVETIINEYEVNEFALFIAALIKLNALNEDFFSILICKIYLAWENDCTDFSDNLFDLLTVLFENSSQLFVDVFSEKLKFFFDDLIKSCETKLNLMMVLPFIFQFLNDKQKSNCENFIEAENEEEQEDENDFNNESHFSLPRFSLFSDSEIVERYQKFISYISNH